MNEGGESAEGKLLEGGRAADFDELGAAVSATRDGADFFLFDFTSSIATNSTNIGININNLKFTS